jgi:hypothetical protein
MRSMWSDMPGLRIREIRNEYIEIITGGREFHAITPKIDPHMDPPLQIMEAKGLIYSAIALYAG